MSDFVVKLKEGANLSEFLSSIKEMGGTVADTGVTYMQVSVYAVLDRIQELPGVEIAEQIVARRTC
jgi:hypothetical protein